MTQQTVKAVFENGVLRPLTPLNGVPERRQVEVTVTVDESAHPLADCVGILPDEDAAEMRAAIEQEFEKVDF